MTTAAALLDAARENAEVAGVPGVEWKEGDAESLPYLDATFDVVVSQFGHMFAPRPELAVAEMRRVLKLSGRMAIATWLPDSLIGRMFPFIGRHLPPPPGVAPPALWGDTNVIAERLAGKFGEVTFERGFMLVPALSLAHYRTFSERSIGPLQKLIESLAGSPDRLDAVRREFEAICEPHYADNVLRSEYLFARAEAR